MCVKLPELLEKQIIRDGFTTCWIWSGTLRNGYGRVWWAPEDRTVSAHKKIYELSVGPVLPGLELDHLCRNRSCVNPEHLEPVTRRENQIRGEGFVAKHVLKTHCPKGHEYNEVNTYLYKNRRSCRPCTAVSKAEYKERKKLGL